MGLRRGRKAGQSREGNGQCRQGPREADDPILLISITVRSVILDIWRINPIDPPTQAASCSGPRVP